MEALECAADPPSLSARRPQNPLAAATKSQNDSQETEHHARHNDAYASPSGEEDEDGGPHEYSTLGNAIPSLQQACECWLLQVCPASPLAQA